MHHRVLLTAICVMFLAACASTPFSRAIERSLAKGPNDFLAMAVVGPQGDGTYVVPTSHVIDPAGQSIEFPGRPTDIKLSPDESLLVLKTTGRSTMSGAGADLVFIEVATRKILPVARNAQRRQQLLRHRLDRRRAGGMGHRCRRLFALRKEAGRRRLCLGRADCASRARWARRIGAGRFLTGRAQRHRLCSSQPEQFRRDR